MAIRKLVSLGRIGFVIEGDYDFTKSYKRLSVVKDASTGSTYIAKTDIPAGVAPNNSSDWFKIIEGQSGSSDVYISQLPLGGINNGNKIAISTPLTRYSIVIKVLNNWISTANYYEDNTKFYVENTNSHVITEVGVANGYKQNDIIICTISENESASCITVSSIATINQTISNINNAIGHVIENINASIEELSSRSDGFMAYGRALFNWSDNSDTLTVVIRDTLDIRTISAILFYCPRDGYKHIEVAAYADDPTERTVIFTLDLATSRPLFAGNTYVIDILKSGDTYSYLLRLVQEKYKVVHSPAYITRINDEEPTSIMINGFANIQTIYDNFEYNFSCINSEFDIDLFDILGVYNGSNITTLTAINYSNYNQLRFVKRFKFMFHIASYYKAIGTNGGNYYKAEGGTNGARFSEAKIYPETYDERVVNDIKVSIPQFYGRTNLELTSFVIPKNTKFTIILLPNLYYNTGYTVYTEASHCPYSMIILFDDFEKLVALNNGGNAVLDDSPAIEEVSVPVQDKLAMIRETTAEVRQNDEYSYEAKTPDYISTLTPIDYAIPSIT